MLEAAYVEAFQAPSTALGVKALLRLYADVVTGDGHVPGCLVVHNSPAPHAEDTLKQWLGGASGSVAAPVGRAFHRRPRW